MSWRSLSLTCPWDTCILQLGKRIENRRWKTAFRGEFLLHAAKGCKRDAYEDCFAFVREAFGLEVATRLPAYEELRRGGIVGVARIVHCQWNTDALRAADPWRMFGQYGFELADIAPLPFVPCSGALGFWRVPPAIVEACGLPPSPGMRPQGELFGETGGAA